MNTTNKNPLITTFYSTVAQQNKPYRPSRYQAMIFNAQENSKLEDYVVALGLQTPIKKYRIRISYVKRQNMYVSC